MFDNLPRDTLLRLKNESVFLIKCQIWEQHGGKSVPCYIGHLYRDENMLDYDPFTCYYNMIDFIMEKP
jgi:hypothetical protein